MTKLSLTLSIHKKDITHINALINISSPNEDYLIALGTLHASIERLEPKQNGH